MRWRGLRDERGSALLFSITLLVIMFVWGGMAIDLLYMTTAKREVQRSVDAAALAGAGKLGFNASVFPTVRQWAQQYANVNPYRGGTVALNLNSGNAPNGDIVLGIWDSGFTPSLNGNQVNAVRCQYATQVPTTFLRLLGFNTLPVIAGATAISNPPVGVGCGEPILPIGVTQCSFFDAGTGAYTSHGCGTALNFIRSQTLCDNSPGSPQGCNTGSWVSLDGSTPNTPYLIDQIQNAANPTGACNVTLRGGQDNTEANNGMMEPVFSALADTFVAMRTIPLPNGDVLDGDGNLVYPAASGGWETGVMMIETPCPPGPISNSHPVETYSYFVITQVFYKQQGCVVWPNPDPQAQAYCANPDGTPRKDNDLRAVFGYFRCGSLGNVATLDPAPRAALAPRIRLVQ